MATSVALTDSEDEEHPSTGASLLVCLKPEWAAQPGDWKASLAGEEARMRQDLPSRGPPALAIDVGEEPGEPARSTSFEWQYDALDAGKAVAAVATVSPGSSLQSQRAPGFFAKDVAAMLRQRAEWTEQLGSGAILCSDDLSDQSSNWGGSDCGEAEEQARQHKETVVVPAGALTAGKEEKPRTGLVDLVATATLDCSVRSEPLCFQKALAHFSGMRLGTGAGGGPASTSNQERRLDPPNRRLQRLHAEADTFCAWAEARSKAARTEATGLPPMAQEASQLTHDAKSLGKLMQSVVAAAGHGAASRTSPKQVWLPVSERQEVADVQRLLELHRSSRGQAALHRYGPAPPVVPTGALSYRLSAQVANGGWLANAEAEGLQALSQRVQRIGELLGTSTVPEGGSLASTAACLHRRLDTLQQVSDVPACEQLRASVQLLSCEIDVAVSEARRLEALEAEERESDIGADFAVEETVGQLASRLFSQVEGLDAVAKRVTDIDQQLAKHNQRFAELQQFADDLASAEARALYTRNLLERAAEATDRMHEAAVSSREQLQLNVAALEAKLAAGAHLQRSSIALPT